MVLLVISKNQKNKRTAKNEGLSNYEQLIYGQYKIYFPAEKGRKEELDDSFRNSVMFERMARKYQRLIFSWKDADDKPFRIFVPVVTIMLNKYPKPLKEQKIDLDLYFNIKTVPDKIELKFNNEDAKKYLTFNTKPVLTGFNPGKSDSVSNKAHKLSITCNGEFSDEYILYARAFGKNNPKGEICGALRFHPNSPAYQQNINLVVFNVKTHINNEDTPPKGKLKPEEETNIHNILGQALTRVNKLETIDLDTTTGNPSADPNYFREKFCIKQDGSWIIDKKRRDEMQEYLLWKIDKIDSKYKEYYKMFVFAENEYDAGYSSGVKYTLLFSTRMMETGAHEFLHSLGLPHTFDGFDRNALFTYESRKTNNMMDYSHLIPKTRNSLEQWQWKIINIKIIR